MSGKEVLKSSLKEEDYGVRIGFSVLQMRLNNEFL
jgi:hypothetical protein